MAWIAKFCNFVMIHYKFLNIGVQIQNDVKLWEGKMHFSFNETAYYQKKKPLISLCLKEKNYILL